MIGVLTDKPIGRRAFSEGKHRDREWMAGFASTCVGGEALVWHSRLEEDVQNDWRLLEQALIERYMTERPQPIQAYVRLLTTLLISH